LEIFDRLLREPFGLEIVVPALIQMGLEETDVLFWLERCVSSDHKMGIVDSRNLCVAMERYPAGARLVGMLVKQGCDVGLLVPSLSGDEEITLLMWALDERHCIDDEVILVILDQDIQGMLSPQLFTNSVRMLKLSITQSQSRIHYSQFKHVRNSLGRAARPNPNNEGVD
jgi:hypothetical protein